MKSQRSSSTEMPKETKSSIIDTTMTAVTTATSSYESYLDLAEKALQKSRKSLDTRALIQLAYGNDTAHIGGSDMLVGILEDSIDKITKETVLEGLKRHGSLNSTCTQNNEVDVRNTRIEKAAEISPQERLNKIDQAISYVINWEQRRDKNEVLDAKSARESLHENLLPEGVTMEDVIVHREYVQRLQAQKTLQQELKRINDEISLLQNQNNEKGKKIREQLGQVEKVEQELQFSANSCAMITT